jgi:hypothetical protein
MKIARIVLLALIVVVAGFVAAAAVSAKTSMMSATGQSENYSSLTAAALADYETNAANSDNVYQQQVVAAWGAKDLLTVVAKQNSQMIDNQDSLIRAQAAQLDNQSNVMGLMKALIVMGALSVAAIAVLGVTLLDRKGHKDVRADEGDSSGQGVVMAS